MEQIYLLSKLKIFVYLLRIVFTKITKRKRYKGSMIESPQVAKFLLDINLQP